MNQVVEHPDNTTEQYAPVVVKVAQPAYAFLVMLGAIAFLPFAFGLFIATPRLSTSYAVLIGLIILTCVCFIWAIDMSTRKARIIGSVLRVSSVIGGYEENCADIISIAYWHDDSAGNVHIESREGVRRIQIDIESMNRFMPLLITLCSGAAVIDCDEGDILEPESGCNLWSSQAPGILSSVLRAMRVNLIRNSMVLAGLFVLCLYLGLKHSLIVAVGAAVVIGPTVLPMVLEIIEVRARLSRIRQLRDTAGRDHKDLLQ